MVFIYCSGFLAAFLKQSSLPQLEAELREFFYWNFAQYVIAVTIHLLRGASINYTFPPNSLMQEQFTMKAGLHVFTVVQKQKFPTRTYGLEVYLECACMHACMHACAHARTRTHTHTQSAKLSVNINQINNWSTLNNKDRHSNPKLNFISTLKNHELWNVVRHISFKHSSILG